MATNPRNRFKKQAKKKTESPIDLRPQQVMCKRLAESMRNAAVELQLQVSGQAAIEGGESKLIVLFSCYPNGDIIVWFLDKGYYSLMALVNQKFRHLVTFPADQADKFQVELTKLQGELGK